MSNPSYDLQAQWIGDGSLESSFTQDGSTLLMASPRIGTPFNIRHVVFEPEYYYEVTLTQLDGHFSVGVVHPDEFKPGYATKGMFFNGNLTNASAALKTSWGPHLKQGDVVGVRTKRQGDSLEVAYYLNGRCLGIGFRISDVTDIYHPCLHMDGTATVTFSTPETLPGLEKTTMETKGVEGDWELFEATRDSTSLDIIPGIVMVVMVDETTMDFSLHVANRMRASASILETNGAGHVVQVGAVTSTMMMGPPRLMAMEKFLSESLPKITVVVEEDSELTMGGTNIKLLWKRHTKLAETLTSYKH